MSEAYRGQIKYSYKPEDIPRNAIRMTPKDVYKYQRYIIDTWKPEREMFLLKYGVLFLGGIAGITGLAMTNHFRNKMLLRNSGRFASYMPAIVIPSLCTSFLQDLYVSKKLISGHLNCPICIEVRSSLIQLTTGAVLPYLLSLLSCSAFAKLTTSYPLPPISDYKLLLQVYAKISKPIKNFGLIVAAFSIINAVMITHKQAQSIEKVNHKMMFDSTNLSNSNVE